MMLFMAVQLGGAITSENMVDNCVCGTAVTGQIDSNLIV